MMQTVKYPRVDSKLLDKFNAYLGDMAGLTFEHDLRRNLESGLVKAARQFGFDDPTAYVRSVLASPAPDVQIEALASFLTVGETYFFRDSDLFQVLRTSVLPELIAERRGKDQRLRIWCAGCATGEEPYSVAILLHALLPDRKDWDITILGSDINRQALQTAVRGEYRNWSFRGVPPVIRTTYFRESGAGTFKLAPAIRSMVAFKYLNLARDPFPSMINNTMAMDAIFCRNVLIYFAPAKARVVLSGFHRALLERGWLVTAASDILQVPHDDFACVIRNRTTLLRKEASACQDADLTNSIVASPRSKSVARQSVIPCKPEGRSAAASSLQVPDDVQDRLLREKAKILYRGGRYEDVARLATALLPFREGAAFLVPRPLIHIADLLTRSLANLGRFREAQAWCEAVIRANKIDPVYHVLLASIFQESNELDEMERCLRRAVFLEPEFAVAHFALGNLARQLGRQDEADKHFDNALKILNRQRQDQILPESEGMTAGRLRQVIMATRGDGL